jgi:adenylate cyclase
MDSADDQVQDAERAFSAEMVDDLADLHLAARIVASSEKTARALRDREPREALEVANLFASLYPRLDIILALHDGRVLGDVGPTETPGNLAEISNLGGLSYTSEQRLFLDHGCARPDAGAPPAQAVLERVAMDGWVLACEPLDVGYLENASDKLQLELALADDTRRVFSATKHFPVELAKLAKAGTTLVELNGRTWAAQRFVPKIAATDARRQLGVVAAVEVTKTSAIVHRHLHWMLGLLGIVALAAVAVGARVAATMARGLRQVVDAFHKMAKQEYCRVPLLRTNDEIELLAIGFNQMVEGLQERDKLRTTFGKYMTESVLQHLLSGKVALGGDTLKVTVLFSDIRSFTSISETMDAQSLVGLLNEYFTDMVSIVMHNGGVIDKYIGDAIMAVFGAPVPANDDAVRAVRAAVEMRAALGQLNERLVARGVQPLRTGIGIHTGEVVAGNIGSEQRMEYTVIGDPVNVASRLESNTKDLGVNVLISESTYQETKGTVRVRPIQALHVKNRTEPIMTYELVGLVDEPAT